MKEKRMRKPSRRLLKIWEFFKANPDKIDMDYWMRPADSRVRYQTNSLETLRQCSGPECGTVGCMAGWTRVFYPKVMEAEAKKFSSSRLGSSNIHLVASKVLGIRQPNVLLPSLWPRLLQRTQGEAAVRALREIFASMDNIVLP